MFTSQTQPDTGGNLTVHLVAQPRRDYAPLWIFVAGIFLLLPSIWLETSVTGGDEYWLSFRTPMEMLARGDWVTPWLNGEPRLQKPPLLYWLILLNYKWFGIHLAGARIWGVLAGAGLASVTCLLARTLFKKSGFLAGGLILATVGVAVEGRRAMLDLPVAFFSTLAVWFFIRWWQSLKTVPSLGAAVALGLACLTKGPVGLLFFGAGALTFGLVFRSPPATRRFVGQLLLAAVVLALICLPWPWLMRHWWPEQFHKVMTEEIHARGFDLGRLKAPFSASLAGLGLVFPWSLMLVGAVVTLMRKGTGFCRREPVWLALWLVVSVLPFLFVETFERYLLGLLPAQCLLVAHWWDSQAGRGTRPWLLVSLAIFSAVFLVFCAFAVWFKVAYFWPLVGLVILVVLWGRRGPACRLEIVAVGVAINFAILLGGIYPSLAINALPADLAAQLAGCAVRQFDSSQPSLLSMRLGYSVKSIGPATTVAALQEAQEPVVVFVEPAQAARFEEWLQAQKLQAEPAGRFSTFFSRKTWLRFTRAGTTWPDWKSAIRQRSLESLKTEIRYYRLKATTGP